MKQFMANFAAVGHGPHHQAQAEEDLAPAPPDRPLSGRHWPESSPGDHMHIEFNMVKRLLRSTKCLYDQTSEAGWHYMTR
jgi:hypothetical protein